MPNYSAVPFLRGGHDVEVAMHADAGKVVAIVAPSWSDVAVVRFYAASTTPPTTPTDTSGWIGTGKTAAALIGVDAWHVKSGEGYVLQRGEVLGTFAFDLACATAAGIAKIRFERVTK